MRGMMLPLGFGEGDDEPVPMPPADIACITLREIAETYQKPCPFKVGDLVTPRRGYWVKGAGEPHVVVEVFDPPRRFFSQEDCEAVNTITYGARLDMRVVCMSSHSRSIVAYCGESWGYEPFVVKDGKQK